MTRLFAIFTDALVVLITWYATHGMRKSLKQFGMKVSIAFTLWRDGALVFPAAAITPDGKDRVLVLFVSCLILCAQTMAQQFL